MNTKHLLLTTLAFIVPLAGAKAQCINPPAGLVAWWPGDGHGFDLSPNHNNGSLAGNAAYGPGLVNQSLQFHGGTDSVIVPDSPSLQIASQFTIQAWINPATYGDEPGSPPGRAIASKVGGAGGNNGYQFYLSSGRPGGQFNSPGAVWPSQWIDAPAPVPLNTWSHVVWTYDQSVMRLFVNGAEVASKVIGAHPIATTSANLRISRDDNGNTPFSGSIDELAIFNRALSANEIAALYAAGSAGMCKPAVTDHFDDANLGTNTLGLGSGWIAVPNGKPVTESGSALSFAAGGGDWGNSKVNGKDTFTSLSQRGHLFTWVVRAPWFSHVAAGLRIQMALVSANGDRNAGNEMWLNTEGGVHGLVLLDAKASSGATSTALHAQVYDNNDTKPSGADGVLRAAVDLGTYFQGEWLTVQLRTTPTGYGWSVNGVDIGGATWQQAGLGFGPGEEFEHGAFAMLMVQNQYSGDGALDCDRFTATTVQEVGVPSAGLVSWWRAEGNALDSAGSQQGNLANGATFAPGQRGLAFQLDGLDDAVRFPGTRYGALDLTNQQLTVSAWVNLASISQPFGLGHVIVGKYWTTSADGYQLQVFNGQLRLDLATSARPDFFLAASQILPTNEWVHVAGTYDGSRACLYVNGAEIASAPLSGSILHNDYDLAIGNDNGLSTEYGFNGLIDEVMIYDRALGADEVENLHVAQGGQPRLHISSEPGAVRLSWPGAADGYWLQATTDLTPGSWETVTDAPSLIGARMEIVLPTVTHPRRFFQLKSGN
ncbi:MAG: LamG domain-containing protein [Verrucomicrobia bacterium]|nr:LamG domain-containing protein [Verrucomicrobiota bacterium]